jgi:hypothetical protein
MSDRPPLASGHARPLFASVRSAQMAARGSWTTMRMSVSSLAPVLQMEVGRTSISINTTHQVFRPGLIQRFAP